MKEVRSRLFTGAAVFAGMALLAVSAWLFVLVAIGHTLTASEKTLAFWWLIASVVVAVAAPIVASKLRSWSQRVARGRSGSGAAGDTARVFSGRMSRAIPLDELLLQACESLRSSFGLLS